MSETSKGASFAGVSQELMRLPVSRHLFFLFWLVMELLPSVSPERLKAAIKKALQKPGYDYDGSVLPHINTERKTRKETQ